MIDILDAHFVHPDGVATALAAMVLRKPFVVTARGCELSHCQYRLRRFWMGWAIRRAARVITVSDNLAQFAVAAGADPMRVKVFRTESILTCSFRGIESSAERGTRSLRGRW